METVLHYIKKYAETQPDTLAVCELKKHLTYAEYWTAIRKMANVLLQNGIKKNAHVILRCTQNIEYMVLFSALQYMQALVILLSDLLHLSACRKSGIRWMQNG